MSKPQKKRGGNWKRTTLIVLCVVLAVILILLACFSTFLNYIDSKLDEINYVTGDTTISPEDASNLAQQDWEDIDPNDSTPIVDPNDITFGPDSFEPMGQGEHIVNILLVGQDRRPGEGTQRSDSMILVTFNKSTKKITLTSFMRDSYVKIPGYGTTKLNHAYQYGGMSLLNQTLYNHYGIEVDGNFEVDFSGFEDIIDLLGGVELELTKKEANHLNKLEGWDLSKGTNILTGEQALLYARIRSIDNDYSRTERQRKVLLSLIEEYKNQSLSKMMALLDELLPLVTTNISKSDIKDYAMELFPMLSGSEMESMRIPVDGTFTEGYIRVSEGQKLWCQYNIDFEANREVLRKIFAK